MDVSIRQDGEGHFIVCCPKNMEWGARVDLVAALEHATGGKPFWSAIIDFGKVSYINSAGLGAVFKLLEHALGLGANVVLCRANPTIARLLRTVNLHALAPMTGSLDDARAVVGLAAEPAAD